MLFVALPFLPKCEKTSLRRRISDMQMMRLLIMTVTLFSFGALAQIVHPAFSALPVANAAEDWPALKLRQPAKLHGDASGSSAVLETVWTHETCIWLDKRDVWVQVRMKKDGHIGWIHQSYLAPAVTTATIVK